MLVPTCQGAGFAATMRCLVCTTADALWLKGRLLPAVLLATTSFTNTIAVAGSQHPAPVPGGTLC